MKSLKEMKYLLLDLDGVCYGSHNGYPLEKVFGLVSKRMTLFIQEKLGLDEKKAKELQTNYFYKYNTSLNGLMLHHNVIGDEFLKYVHDIDISFMKEDKIMRNELENLKMEKFIFTNGSAEHAQNILTRLGIYDLFGKEILAHNLIEEHFIRACESFNFKQISMSARLCRQSSLQEK